MRARLEDVARAVGVSSKTVSRVLNDEPNVRASTRKRVMAAAKELDYQLHPSARSLAANRSFLVALVYDNPSPNYVMEVQAGVLEACDPYHYSMMVRPLASDAPNFVERVMTLVLQRRPDGLILTPPITDHAGLLSSLRERQVPFACISPRDTQACIGVTLDERRASSEMVQHLIRLGHRRIAHVIGHPAHGGSEWRLAGYLDGLKQAGIEYDPGIVVQGEFSFSSGVRAAHKLMSVDHPPTAIFAANDDMAAGAMWAIAQLGMVVPDDVSVCGFDDTPMATQVWPALTTVHQPSRDMGRIAARQLLRVMRDEEAGEMVPMPFTLQPRESTGPVRSSAKGTLPDKRRDRDANRA